MEDKTKRDLEKIVFVLNELDEDRSLETEQGLSLTSIENNIKEKYTSVEEFQADFDQLCRQLLSITLNKEKKASISALWKLGNSYLSELHSQQKLQLNETSPTSYQPNEVQNDFHRNIALFQRGGEGFLFTSSKRGFKPQEHLDIIGEVRPMTIFPTQVSEKAPPLGVVCSTPHPVSASQYSKQESINPLLFVGHDAYSSFAPCLDSSTATLSSQDTTTLYYFKKRKLSSNANEGLSVNGSVPAERDDPHNKTTQIAKEKVAGEQCGVENGVSSVSTADTNKSSQESNETNSASFFLEENSKLLLKLADFQDARTRDDFSFISPLEQATAKAFVSRMVHILPSVKPSALISPECIESAIDRIPIPERTYRGTLPPNKPFAYATNSALGKGFATNATTVPGYIPRS